MSAIAAEGLTVALGGNPILHGIDLNVAGGEWVAVVGPNGAGKSTLLRALAGLVSCQGRVTLDDEPIDDLNRRSRARAIAMVPQHPVVPPGMTLGEYALLGRTPHLAPLAVEEKRDLDIVHWTLVELDLLPFASRPLTAVSGGELQRAFIARALAQQAPILLLDEPTTALDVGHAQEVLELIDRLRHDRDLTVVMTMHDLTLAGQYADRLVLLDQGLVIASGTATEVLTAEALTLYYGARVDVVQGPDGPVVVPRRGGLTAEVREEMQEGSP